MIKVLVAGFMGSMGQKTVQMVNENDDFELVGAYNPGIDVAHMQGMGLSDNVKLFSSLMILTPMLMFGLTSRSQAPSLAT